MSIQIRTRQQYEAQEVGISISDQEASVKLTELIIKFGIPKKVEIDTDQIMAGVTIRFYFDNDNIIIINTSAVGTPNWCKANVGIRVNFDY